MVDAYPGLSPVPLHVHRVCPVSLSSATMLTSWPPGQHITLSPSTNGDSLIPHVIFRPPNFSTKSTPQIVAPVRASIQIRSRSPLRWYSLPPTIVGVERAPGCERVYAGPFLRFHISLPDISRAVIMVSGPMLPVVYIIPSAIATVEYPWPIPSAFQTISGPPSGHFVSNPVSSERLSRRGP